MPMRNGSICIAPAVVAKLFGGEGVHLTIGDDAATAKRLESKGAKHVKCKVDEICVDDQARVVSTPAYMLATRVSEVAKGVDKLCDAVVRMAR